MVQTVTKRRKPGTLPMYGLREARKSRGLSIRSLAELAQVSPDTAWRLETLQREAEPSTRRRLAQALGVKIRDLTAPPKEEEEEEGHE